MLLNSFSFSFFFFLQGRPLFKRVNEDPSATGLQSVWRLAPPNPFYRVIRY